MFNPSHDEAMRMLGTPSIFSLKDQYVYRTFASHDDRNDPIYIADREWFLLHPHQQRIIRRAKGNEFRCAETYYVSPTGKRIDAPRLYVLVERRFSGADHMITPVFRGMTHSRFDRGGYLLVVDEEEDNCVDRLLFKMRTADGYDPVQMYEYYEGVAVLAYGIADGPIH